MRAEDVTGQDMSNVSSSEPGEAGVHPPRAISLDEVVTREVPIQWDEAVAVVEELCSLLSAVGDAEPLVPELSDVLITDGWVVVQEGAGGQRGANHAGRILHALLSTGNVPIALRLFVTKSTSPDAFATIDEFADALAYFGKATRPELIRALFERCVAQSALSSGTPRPRQEQVSEKPASEPPKRRLSAWAVAAAAAVLLLGAATWLWSERANPGHEPLLPTLISETRSTVYKLGTQVREALKAIAESSGGVPSSVDNKQGPPVSRPARSPRRARNRQGPSPGPAEAVPPQSEQTASAVAVVDLQPIVDTTPQDAEILVNEADLSAIYSRLDRDVQPPVPLYPQLPVMRDSARKAANSIELVVSELGTVEHVRLIAGPSRMPDMMLLSGAKTWRFQPAFKDGRPVRYRTVVNWFGGP